jgi:hypothetical protein
MMVDTYSLKGAKIMGPNIYPIKYIDTGRTSNRSFSTFQYSRTNEVVPDGKALPMVELRTIIMPTITT